MLRFGSGKTYQLCDGINRREWLQLGALGLGGLTMADLLRLRAEGKSSTKTSHKAVILVFLNGGASQLDMFDMKPKAPAEFRGEFKPVQTNVPGMDVCELLPRHAKMANRYAILQGMQQITSGHSLYEASTGFGGRAQPMRPAFGAWVSRFSKSRNNGMPPWVKMSGGSGPAFLGSNHNGFNPSGGLMADLRGPRGGMPKDRIELLKELDTLGGKVESDPEVIATDTYTAKALEMMATTRIRDAFDLKKESDKVKSKYGKQSYGGLTLLQALRLAEAGVSCITVYGPGNGKWDTHKNNFTTLKSKILPEYDQNITAMIADLYDRGLDKDVAIAIYGEFGRTPRINKNAGRDHYPQSNFVQIVGGGLKMGQTIGNTGLRGDQDISRSKPYTIQNLMATLYHVLGIDPGVKVPDNFGRPQYLLEQRELIKELI